MQKGGEMKHMVPAQQEGVAAKAKALMARTARGMRKAFVSGVAITVMMVAYGISTIGAIGSSALGLSTVAGVAALTANASPASAHRWRRRRRRFSRGYSGFYSPYSYPSYRRRRRRGGIYLYF